MTNGAIYCNRCGSQNSALGKFCANCGTPLSSEVQPPAPPAVVPEITPRPQGPAWQPPAVGYKWEAAPTTRYGGFWLRFVAAFIDGILIQVVVIPVGALVGAMIGIAGSAVSMPGEGIQAVSFLVGAVLGMLASWIYEAAMESSSKQATLGKMTLGLKVTDLEGRRISFGRATGRHFAKYVSGLTLLIGYIMAGFTQRKQALHDMIAGTLVMRPQ